MDNDQTVVNQNVCHENTPEKIYEGDQNPINREKSNNDSH